MGVVYKAEDTKLKRLVALKFLPSSIMASEAEKARFIHEAQAAALDHPNICTVYEIDEAEGQLFIAMAYVEGQSLKEKIEAGPLKLDEALNIAMQVAEGLQAAHEKGITHRDIKPANVMITNKGQAKIMDFGLAKQAGRTVVTKEGMTLGTVAYMSPEQARGENVDHRTDIWSFGVVLYEIITGQHPFKGEYEQAEMYSIMNETPEPMTGLRTGVPMELERIVDKAMAKKTDERYQHVGDLLVDLRMLHKQIETGTPKSRTIGTNKTAFQKSKRTYLYGAVATLLVLLVAGGLYFFLNSGKTIESLAILPFENTSRNPDTEYLSDGITESLINSLSQMPKLKVISRISVFRYKGKEVDPKTVGRDLNVRAVLTGRVVQHGDGLFISTELVNADDNSQIWGEKYNRKLADLLALQDEISREISEKLRLCLSGEDKLRLTKRYTENLEAYQLYLKGRYYALQFTEEGLKKSVECFNQAIELDPNYALAYAGLAAGCWLVNDLQFAPLEVMPKAKAAAQRALELDSMLAQAHTAMAMVKTAFEWDWLSAEREFKRAIVLHPDDATVHGWYGWYLGIMARFEEAQAELQLAQKLDPLSPDINAFAGVSFHWARQYAQAIDQLRRTINLEPTYWIARTYLGWAYVENRQFTEAISELQKAKEIEDNHFVLGSLGYAYARAGKRDEAQRVIATLTMWSQQRFVSPYSMVIVYAALGEKDLAFQWLDKAYDERAELMGWLKVDPRLDNLRSDSRFSDLMKKMDLEK
jgi:serine/threonine protein kinase/Tfp pilus assembly protein PilF